MIDLSPSRPKPSLLFAPLFLLVACSEAGPAGPGSSDSGAGADSGNGILLDAGYLPRDAEPEDVNGSPDLGVVSGDAGFGGSDAGRPDTGALFVDSGSPVDAGFVAHDSGALADSGVVVDAGAVIDAGTAADAGFTAADAGAQSPDAGQGADAGVDSDAGPGVGSACDVLTQNCPSGLGCYLVSLTPLPEVWQCYTAGTVPFGGSCATQNDCGPGSVCLNGAGYGCLQVCRYPNGSCSGGLPCQPLSPNGNHGYCRSDP